MEEILVVDDDRQVLELLKHILKGEGVVVHCVESGEKALEKIMERTFSLMITDLHMPGLDGFELSRKGREIAPQMPIIMNTGDTSPKTTRMAKEIGISKVLSKPCPPNEMRETIRSVLGKRRECASSAGSSL